MNDKTKNRWILVSSKFLIKAFITDTID